MTYTTLFFRHLHAENPAIQTQDSWLLHFLLLWTPHLEFTPTGPQPLIAQPCHLLKPNWKPSSSQPKYNILYTHVEHSRTKTVYTDVIWKHTHSYTHTDCSRNWVLILVGVEILCCNINVSCERSGRWWAHYKCALLFLLLILLCHCQL